MTKTFLISDTHFVHHNAYVKFTMPDGSPLRPWASTEEGDEAMVERWNSVVTATDKVVHLGDVAIARRGLKFLERLNGRKILVPGNHDVFKLRDYTPYFEDIKGTHKMGEFIVSHYPIHPSSLPSWANANIHGHTHGQLVMKERRSFFRPWHVIREPDSRYINVSVEQINFTPIDFEAIRARYRV